MTSERCWAEAASGTGAAWGYSSMTKENLMHAWGLARDHRVDERELSALQQCAMRTAKALGCEAGVGEMDFVASDPPGSLRLKIVVVRRTRRGNLLCHESNVVLMTSEHAASVGQIVRDGATRLAER